MSITHPKPGLPLRQVDYVAAKVSVTQVLCVATIGTGALMAATGPSSTPYLEWLTALPVWPVLFGVALASAGFALAAGSHWRVHPLATAGAGLGGLLFLILALGFAVGWAAYLADPAEHPDPFVYPLAVYSGLAALHFVHADTAGRAWRRTRELRR